MIRDQRHMEGGKATASLEEVRAGQGEILRKILMSNGGEFRHSTRSKLEHRTDGEAVAFVNDNRWIALCPDTECNAGIAVWWGNSEAVCFDCGSVWPVRFPSMQVIGQATSVLLARPPVNRNWDPATETVDDLKTQNLLKGYPLTGVDTDVVDSP